MPLTGHIEHHFPSGEAVRDVVIGMADGLTVPFALAAGLSGTVVATRVVVIAGIAKISTGAMGLGGYLAARSDAEHDASERKREVLETKTIPAVASQEITRMFEACGIAPKDSESVVSALCLNRKAWVDFMMWFELELERPDPKRATKSALTIGGAYVAWGLIPLLPYMVLNNLPVALRVSVGATLVALLVFGFVKAEFTGSAPIRSALQTLQVGGLAAAAAFMIAHAIA